MEQILEHLKSLNGQVDPYTRPVATVAIPLAGVYLATKFLGSFWRRVLGPLLLGEVRWREMGEWAVVAGASYGIGGQYARELAKRGCNVFLIGQDAVRDK